MYRIIIANIQTIKSMAKEKKKKSSRIRGREDGRRERYGRKAVVKERDIEKED